MKPTRRPTQGPGLGNRPLSPVVMAEAWPARIGKASVLSAGLLALGACTVADKLNIPVPEILNIRKEAPANEKPAGITRFVRTAYDGQSDDLLTAGLGKSGLQSPTPPDITDINKPSLAELRRRAIYLNYRAVLDMSEAGGYGRFYGPNLDAQGQPVAGEGKIAGVEYLAFADDGSSQKNVTMMVQIPFNFNQAKPCIVAAPSSGSRGVYGAIGTSGEWGLKKGCAVAYTDKGTGAGTHDLTRNTVIGLRGEVLAAQNAGRESQFTADLLPNRRAAFAAEMPERFALKHAHSQQNPEKDWGKDVLTSIRFALWALNEEYVATDSRGLKLVRFQPDNTLIIAASVSNGGGAVLRAAEMDSTGLIDGVVASEPQVQPRLSRNVSIEQGRNRVKAMGLPLFEYASLANLYQACAAFAPVNKDSPGLAFLPAERSRNRCDTLRRAGLLQSNDPLSQATESLAILNANGWLPDSNLLHAMHFALATPGVTVTYAMSYSRASVIDNLCGYSFGAADINTGKALAAPAFVMAGMFAHSSGLTPSGGLFTLNHHSEGGPAIDQASTSPVTHRQDYNAEGAICLRSLIAEVPGQNTSAIRQRQATDLRRGISDVLASGNLHGKPAIIVHGRSDALVPVNHSSRPYYALNQAIEGADSRLRYIEVTNAHHFDAVNSNPAMAGMDTRFVPLHPYFLQALDNMYRHLSLKSALPDSQVVRTVPRGGSPGQAKPLSAANIPPFQQEASAPNRIVFSGGTLLIAE